MDHRKNDQRITMSNILKIFLILIMLGDLLDVIEGGGKAYN